MTPEEWRTVKDLFGRARDRPPSERAALLDSECAGEPERRREVESLLSSSEESWSLLDDPPAPLLASVVPAEEEIGTRDGERIGPFRIISEIGRGGMGAVYLAQRVDGQFEQTVALKLVKRGMDTEAVLARFRQEREILARLHHPNIAQLYDGGATEDGLPYFAMEHVEGEPLLEYCNRRQLSVSERLRLFRTVCSSVHYAHRSLIVHRDIKPSNIIVTPEGVPKLLDFGIAKIQESGVADQTATGLRALTPDYASPEQLRGEPVTTATDVFSLGVVLYELLTGRKPCRVATGEPGEIARVLWEQEPARPSAIARELKGDVENIVLKAIRKEPERRYASAEQLAEDIRLHLDGLPILARKDTAAYRVGKFVRRNRMLVSAASFVFVSLVGGIGISLRQAAIARAEKAKAQRRFEDVRKLANSFLFEFQDSIKDLAGSTPARELLVRRGLQYLDSLASEAAGDPQVMRDLAQGYQKLGQLQGDFGSGSAALGDMDGAIVSYRKAQAIREALVRTDGSTEEDRLALADLYARMSQSISHGGEGDIAIDLARRAVAIGESLLEGDRYPPVASSLAYYYLSLGIALKYAGRSEEALAAFQKNVTLTERVSAADSTNLKWRRSAAVAHMKVGDTLNENGQAANAVPEYRKAVAIGTELTSREPTNAQFERDLSFFHASLGDALRKVGDVAGAVESSLKAVEIRRILAAADPKNPNPRLWLASACSDLGENLVAAGERSGGMSRLREAMSLFGSVLEVKPGDPMALQELAAAQKIMGETYWKNLSSATRIPNLRQARFWFEKSRSTYASLQGQGRLPAFYSRNVEAVKESLVRCDEELARLGEH